MKVEGTEHEFEKRRGGEERGKENERESIKYSAGNIIEQERIEKMCGYAGEKGGSNTEIKKVAPEDSCLGHPCI